MNTLRDFDGPGEGCNAEDGPGCELHLLDHSKENDGSTSNNFQVKLKDLRFHNKFDSALWSSQEYSQSSGCLKSGDCSAARFVNAQREVGLRYR